MRLKVFSPSMVKIVWVLMLVAPALSFDCSNYGPGSADQTFCRETACRDYCAMHSIPEYCMDAHYTSPGICSQLSGFPQDICQKVTGIKPEHKHFCQTEACDYSMNQCRKQNGSDCEGSAQSWILQIYPDYCESVGPTQAPIPTTATAPTQAPTAAPTTKPTTTTKVTTTTKATTTTKLTTNPATEEAGDGGCWSPEGWGLSTCFLCTAVQANQCTSNGWNACYPTKKACQMSAAGGASCGNECALNTLKLKRPQFLGASCYNSEYGSQFGPNWVPTGKTSFEKYIPDPTSLYKMVQTTSDDLPWLQKSWGLKGCDAAAAVYENVVCAIELLDSLKRQFEGTKGSAGNFITDFANSGDDQTDRRELAAFFSHKFKETARMQVWEEVPNPNYADCGNTEWPCGPHPYYHGRGPVQLSWNYNYGPFSQWFYGDKMVLLNDPDKVDPEGPMGFISAFWFWMTPRQFTSGMPVAGNIRTRDAIVHWTDGKMNQIYQDGVDYDSVAGLALSTNVINGGIECSPGSESPLWRVQYFLTAAARIGVDLPDVNNQAACRADKYCNGLFSGCTNFKGATCEPMDTLCGPAYVDGWQGQQCKGTN